MDTQGQAAPAPLPRHPRPRTRQVPVRRLAPRPAWRRSASACTPSRTTRRSCRSRGRSSTSACTTSRRRSTATRCARAGSRHARRDRRRGARTESPRHGTRGTSCAQAVEPWRQMGLEPQIAFELEFYLLEPDGGGRLAARPGPGAPRLRHRHVGRPVGRDRRHRERGARVRVPGRELVQRVRQRRLRGEHQVRRRDPRRRRGVPVQAAGPRDLRAAREARDVPRPAARRSRRQRPARELLVPPRRRLERVPRPERPRGPLGPHPEVHRRPAGAPRGHGRDPRARTSTRTSGCSPTC